MGILSNQAGPLVIFMAGLSSENKLRDVYNMRVVGNLAKRIKTVYPAFDDLGFLKTIDAKLEELSFGERSALIRQALKTYLPKDFKRSARILINSLEPELSCDPGETIWDGFIIVPESEFIAENGMDHFELSMKALYEMTKRFSSEGAIRPFIEKYPEETFRLLKKWTADRNVHVRRLVSEGSRPRLPLSAPLRDLKKDPRPVLGLLEILKDDPELYVRRSVANNLNDISKDNPDLVVKTLAEWKKNATKERQWICSHALRTLFKRGHKGALALMGYQKPEVADVSLTLDNNMVPAGGSLEFCVKFHSAKRQKLMVDYRIHYMKSNGKNLGKVFKFSSKTVSAGETIVMRGRQSFKSISTRKHYAGKHFIEVIINGVNFGKKEFAYEHDSAPP
jgi:3-methyladenine DNA glycosylase AlkC